MVKLRGPLTGGVSISKHDVINEQNRKEEHRHLFVPSGTDYAKEIREKETENHLKVNNIHYTLFTYTHLRFTLIIYITVLPFYHSCTFTVYTYVFMSFDC